MNYIDAPTRKLFAKRLGRKYQLLFDILLNTGLRTSELVTLREADVNLEGECIIIRTNETAHRQIPLNASAKASLYLWMQEYKGEGFVFDMEDTVASVPHCPTATALTTI